MKKLLVIGILCGLWGTSGQAADEASARSAQLELGASLGTPAGLNAVVAVWGPKSLPLLLRASGGYLASSLGFGAEAGFIFDRDGDFRQYLAVGAEAGAGLWPFSGQMAQYFGVGPHYGFNWKGLSLDFGVLFGSGDASLAILELRNYRGPIPVLQVGYSFFLF